MQKTLMAIVLMYQICLNVFRQEDATKSEVAENSVEAIKLHIKVMRASGFENSGS